MSSSHSIHDNEADTSEGTVQRLLADQCPHWAQLPRAYLASSGTSNAMWRLQRERKPDLVVRLPRTAGAAASVARELDLLPVLAQTPVAGMVAVPRLSHAGVPAAGFEFPWAVFEWIEGDDLWSARHEASADSDTLARDLARVVAAIGSLGPDLPVRVRRDGDRGGPLPPLLQRLERWLADPAWSAAQLIDTAAVRRFAAQAREMADEPVAARVVHGDLIPGNLLLRGGSLDAIIDWGGAGRGDPAQDLAPAWAVFGRRGRRAFREALAVDEPAWMRARMFELEHAVGGVLYYTPRRHPLGEVMTRTLERILADT